MKSFFYLTILAITALFFTFSPAQASDPKLLSTHGDWSVFTFAEGGNKVCFMASQPTKSAGNYQRRGEVFALITHRPSEKSFDVFSFVAGYTYKAGSDVQLSIGNNKYTLFTQGDTAWAYDSERDRAIANAIRSGSNLVVTGHSSRGTKTTDTFSLRGSTAAHQAMNKACGR